MHLLRIIIEGLFVFFFNQIILFIANVDGGIHLYQVVIPYILLFNLDTPI